MARNEGRLFKTNVRCGTVSSVFTALLVPEQRLAVLDKGETLMLLEASPHYPNWARSIPYLKVMCRLGAVYIAKAYVTV